jgi:hypothetical protein
MQRGVKKPVNWASLIDDSPKYRIVKIPHMLLQDSNFKVLESLLKFLDLTLHYQIDSPLQYTVGRHYPEFSLSLLVA